MLQRLADHFRLSDIAFFLFAWASDARTLYQEVPLSADLGTVDASLSGPVDAATARCVTDSLANNTAFMEGPCGKTTLWVVTESSTDFYVSRHAQSLESARPILLVDWSHSRADSLFGGYFRSQLTAYDIISLAARCEALVGIRCVPGFDNSTAAITGRHLPEISCALFSLLPAFSRAMCLRGLL